MSEKPFNLGAAGFPSLNQWDTISEDDLAVEINNLTQYPMSPYGAHSPIVQFAFQELARKRNERQIKDTILIARYSLGISIVSMITAIIFGLTQL